MGFAAYTFQYMPAEYLLALLTAVVIGTRPQSVGIERVSWLQGCWEAKSPRRVIEENWTAPRGANMLGVSRTFRGDSLAEYELMVLRQQAGGLVYEAHPSGQSAAAFTARTVTDSVVVFENATHDFPQRVGYRKARGDSLVAWIEGTVEGRPRRVEFQYERVPCPGR